MTKEEAIKHICVNYKYLFLNIHNIGTIYEKVQIFVEDINDEKLISSLEIIKKEISPIEIEIEERDIAKFC